MNYNWNVYKIFKNGKRAKAPLMQFEASEEDHVSFFEEEVRKNLSNSMKGEIFKLIRSDLPQERATEKIDETNEQFNNADPEVKNFEPKLALVGGDDGLKFYREYSNNLKNLMNKSAHFICEIGINQRQICEEIFENSGLYLNKIINDLQGIERILSFSKI